MTLYEKTARMVSFDRTFAYTADTIGAGGLRRWCRADRARAPPWVYDPAPCSATPPCAMPSHQPISYSWTKSHAGWSMPSGSPIPAMCRACSSIPARQGAGLAARIGVNPAVDPALGGDLARLRDGVTMNFNIDGDAAFSDRLYGMLQALDQPQGFDPATGINPNTTLSRFASSSVSWLEAGRQEASQEASFRDTFLERTRESLSNVTGVNLDEELAMMMELERSYGASARIISAVDTMLQTLLAATR